MVSPDQIAGHPVAIRVGGRRMSQSNTSRSPTKQQQQTTPSSSVESTTATMPPIVPDYPRPRSADQVHSNADTGLEKDNNASNGDADNDQTRQERRRHERKRDKNHREENKIPEKGDFRHLQKGASSSHEHHRRSSAGGMRITQPTGKFM